MVDHAEPIQTVLVTCRGHSEVLGKNIHKDNIITLDWHMPVSFKPPLYAISVGKNRFSHGLIASSKCFAVNFIDQAFKEDALFCGRNSGASEDKFQHISLGKEECEKIECPRLKKALAYLECEVEQEIDAGDHTVFIGRILIQAHNDEGNRLFHTSGDRFITIR